MFSLEAIPEPSNNAPPTEPTDTAHHQLIATAPVDSATPTTGPETNTPPTEEADQHVDSIAVLLVLLIAGSLLRLVLGLLGPLQGITPHHIQLAQDQGKAILAGETHTAYPLFDLLAHGIGLTGLPAWALVLFGAALTIASIPAAFVLGQTLTGRRTAGIVAAGIIAVHPAVLTAANSYSNAAIAIGLITLGLAALCFIERKGAVVAIIGGIALGLAGMAAPLCWLVGVLAGPMAYKLSKPRGSAKAFGLALVVTLLALAPAAAYRATFLGQDANALLTEWQSNNTTEHTLTPMSRLLVTMTHTSFTELGEAMHLPLGDAGRLKITTTAAPLQTGERDQVADVLADGWLVLNAALAGLAAISIGVMIARRRLAETIVLVIPLAAMAFSTLPPSEALRLPMIALVGILATGLFAKRSIPYIDEEARQAKHLAKLAKRDAKEQAKQERELKKHKEAIYAFDESTRPKKQKKGKPSKQAPDQPQEAILTQHEDEPPAMSARPI